MLKKLVRDAVLALWPELTEMLKGDVTLALLREIQGVYKIDPHTQYIIVVRDDQTAQDLVSEINQRFDPASPVIVMAAEDVRVIQITKRR